MAAILPYILHPSSLFVTPGIAAAIADRPLPIVRWAPIIAAMTTTRDQAVADQYEVLPYPGRDPRDEARRLVVGSPSHLAEIEHYLFAGRLPQDRPLRALIAGGGTGDAAIMLAQQLADRGVAAELVYLDASAASRRVAEARAQARSLTALRFVTGSLLDLPALALGQFDYIDCCGVLHHLEDPAAGLAALVSVLAPSGGMGLMLYGEAGRSGVYEAQEILRLIAADGPPATRIAGARKLVAELPSNHWLKVNPALSPTNDDAALFDLLLHARDRPYSVPEIAALLDTSSLRLVSFIEPDSYDPDFYLKDPTLARRLADLAPIERAAIAELIAGNLPRHVFYCTHAANPVVPPSLESAGMVAIPVLRDLDGVRLADQLGTGKRLTGTKDGLERSLALPPHAGSMLRLIDGTRSLREIHAGLAERRFDEAAFRAEFAALYRTLHGINWLLLRLPETALP
jgi:SAM-dependent methyltransferase